MNARDAIKTALTGTQGLLNWYLSDLSDADLLVRPAAGANHIAWQLGHLIVSESVLVGPTVPEARYPELPAGFREQHTRDTAGLDDPQSFRSKAEYLSLFKEVRNATVAVLDRLTDADLDRPSQGNMAKFAPTAGALLLLVSNHTLMHGGQFTVVRRLLNKPVLF